MTASVVHCFVYSRLRQVGDRFLKLRSTVWQHRVAHYPFCWQGGLFFKG
jgi:hypothetical protein